MSVPLAIEIDCVGPTNGLDISGDYSELQEATSVETLECFMMSLLIHHPQSDMGAIPLIITISEAS